MNPFLKISLNLTITDFENLKIRWMFHKNMWWVCILQNMYIFDLKNPQCSSNLKLLINKLYLQVTIFFFHYVWNAPPPSRHLHSLVNTWQFLSSLYDLFTKGRRIFFLITVPLRSPFSIIPCHGNFKKKKCAFPYTVVNPILA